MLIQGLLNQGSRGLTLNERSTFNKNGECYPQPNQKSTSKNHSLCECVLPRICAFCIAFRFAKPRRRHRHSLHSLAHASTSSQRSCCLQTGNKDLNRNGNGAQCEVQERQRRTPRAIKQTLNITRFQFCLSIVSLRGENHCILFCFSTHVMVLQVSGCESLTHAQHHEKVGPNSWAKTRNVTRFPRNHRRRMT